MTMNGKRQSPVERDAASDAPSVLDNGSARATLSLRPDLI